MSSKFLAAVLIGGLCAAAAGGGAYLAVKQNAQAAPSATVDMASAAAPTPATTPAPVAATPTAAAAPAPAPATPPALEEGPASVKSSDTPSPTGSAAAPPPQRAKSALRQPVAQSPRPAPAPAVTRSAPAVTAPNAEPLAMTNEAPVPAAAAPAAAPSPYIPSRPTIETPQAEPVAAPAAKVEEDDLEDLQVPADAVIGLQVDRTVSSDFARIEDRVDARVTRDVRVGGQIAIPAGAKVRGSVTMVEQGGKFKTRARLAVKFHTIFLPDGTQVPIQTEAIYREGGSPSGDARAKIGGGAVGGAIIGAILGGRKGAAIGSTLGAGAGTAAVAAGDNDPATLPSGSTVTVRLRSPATITIEKHHH